MIIRRPIMYGIFRLPGNMKDMLWFSGMIMEIIIIITTGFTGIIPAGDISSSIFHLIYFSPGCRPDMKKFISMEGYITGMATFILNIRRKATELFPGPMGFM